MITGIVQLSGRLRYAPPVPFVDQSANAEWLADVLQQMPCSGRKEEEYVLTADGDTAVSFGSLVNGANWIVVKVAPNFGLPPTPLTPDGVPAAPNPVTVKLTGTAGTAEAVTVDPFMVLVSVNGPYTAMTIARTTGVQTTVRVQLFAVGS